MTLFTLAITIIGILVIFGLLFLAEYVWDFWVTWPFEQ